MLSHPTLQRDCDIKRPAGRHGPADTRHGDDTDIFDLDVRRRFGNEDQALIQEVQKTFVGFDGALDAAVAVVTLEIGRWRNDLLAGQAAEDLGHHLVDWLFIMGLQFIFVLGLQHLPETVSTVLEHGEVLTLSYSAPD